MGKVALIRAISFTLMLLVCIIIQWKKPSRPVMENRWQYMVSNLVIVVFNNLILGLLPLIPFQMAVMAYNRGWGIMNMLNTDSAGLNFTKLILGMAVLDLVIYFQHRIFHQWSPLRRLHAVHHTDPMLDVTSALRFHPLEIAISNGLKIMTVLVLGISPLTVIIFEVGLNLLAMFNHSNIAISKEAEAVISKVLITPALHTIHHSRIREETNSNYGFSVPWWDKLFGTFVAQGKYPQHEIEIGAAFEPEARWSLFPGMLVQPFLKREP